MSTFMYAPPEEGEAMSPVVMVEWRYENSMNAASVTNFTEHRTCLVSDKFKF